MPRIAGQIDERKREAILDAASELLAEKGLAVSMEEIARRAGVSKQTLYNRFASKTDIARALAERRSDLITAPLRTTEEPEVVLTALARAMLDKAGEPDQKTSMRGLALISPHAPELASAVYDAGPGESLRRLAQWLAEQDRRGMIRVPDPALAAEMFTGMVLGHTNLKLVLGVDAGVTNIPGRASETARRFLRAFATMSEG
ncbi:TetR/AcrR family transcriptional regulator [Brevundimonas variabilis]|uniref:AcrR family transcriptional regulator n=1 Tax=Brevundimonas variabilis TaxID=74312 RepID=A0A7W9FGF3_9CAUL|nr:TetR/AcrR family transcriptional regulator [Brevundimonas variabilis]MBB5746369.1 AcrR family transcriptional regulator [Brevundimonas variabilis]